MRIFAVLALCASSALAETSDVPHLADGTVDVNAVLSSFKVANPVYSDGKTGKLKGVILGKSFDASVTGDVLSAQFSLTISSKDLSEEATYLAAVLLNDVICLRQSRSPDELSWADTATKVGIAWTVMASCSIKPRFPTPIGSYRAEVHAVGWVKPTAATPSCRYHTLSAWVSPTLHFVGTAG